MDYFDYFSEKERKIAIEAYKYGYRRGLIVGRLDEVKANLNGCKQKAEWLQLREKELRDRLFDKTE